MFGPVHRSVSLRLLLVVALPDRCPAGHADTVVITVSNTADLTAADCEAMFARFWRRDTARTAGTDTGLGLAPTRGLAELLGGTLVASAPQFGSVCFPLTLPAAAPA